MSLASDLDRIARQAPLVGDFCRAMSPDLVSLGAKSDQSVHASLVMALTLDLLDLPQAKGNRACRQIVSAIEEAFLVGKRRVDVLEVALNFARICIKTEAFTDRKSITGFLSLFTVALDSERIDAIAHLGEAIASSVVPRFRLNRTLEDFEVLRKGQHLVPPGQHGRLLDYFFECMRHDQFMEDSKVSDILSSHLFPAKVNVRASEASYLPGKDQPSLARMWKELRDLNKCCDELRAWAANHEESASFLLEEFFRAIHYGCTDDSRHVPLSSLISAVRGFAADPRMSPSLMADALGALQGRWNVESVEMAISFSLSMSRPFSALPKQFGLLSDRSEELLKALYAYDGERFPVINTRILFAKIEDSILAAFNGSEPEKWEQEAIRRVCYSIQTALDRGHLTPNFWSTIEDLVEGDLMIELIGDRTDSAQTMYSSICSFHRLYWTNVTNDFLVEVVSSKLGQSIGWETHTSTLWNDIAAYGRGEWSPSNWSQLSLCLERWVKDPLLSDDDVARAFYFFAYQQWQKGQEFIDPNILIEIEIDLDPHYQKTNARKIASIVRAGFTSSLESLTRVIQDRQLPLMQKDLHEYLRGESPFPDSYGVDKVLNTFHALPQNEMHRQVLQTYDRGLELYRGFRAMAVEAKRPAKGFDSLAVAFAQECFVSTGVLNSESNEKIPGFGLLYSGMDVEKLFIENSPGSTVSFEDYKLAWPWAANEIDHLGGTKFLYARGVMGIVPPQTDGYMLDGVHYSLMVYNDHYHNPVDWVAYLIPTELLSEALENRIVPLRDYNGRYSPDFDSSTNDALYPPAFYKRAKEKGLNVLNLGWPSNLAGLGNAYPAASAPHFSWERLTNDRNFRRDMAGHVNMTLSLDPHDPSWEPMVRAAENLHDNVYTLAKRCYNLHDLFRLGRAIWHKGQDMPGQNGEFENRDDSEAQEPERDEDEEGIHSEITAGRELRMLRQACAFHENRLRGVSDPALFPDLVMAPTLDYTAVIQSPFRLSTYDMVLTTASGEKIQLPKDEFEIDEASAEIWRTEVLAHVRTSDADLRFYLLN